MLILHTQLKYNENIHSVVRDNINLIKINLVHETDIFFARHWNGEGGESIPKSQRAHYVFRNIDFHSI